MAMHEMDVREYEAISRGIFSPFGDTSPVKSMISAKFVKWSQKQTVSVASDNSNEILHPRLDHSSLVSSQYTQVRRETLSFSNARKRQ